MVVEEMVRGEDGFKEQEPNAIDDILWITRFTGGSVDQVYPKTPFIN